MLTTPLGLRSMRKRTEMLGGDHRVDSSLGAGTRVELKVPIDGGYSVLAKGIVSRRPIREPPRDVKSLPTC